MKNTLLLAFSLCLLLAGRTSLACGETDIGCNPDGSPPPAGYCQDEARDYFLNHFDEAALSKDGYGYGWPKGYGRSSTEGFSIEGKVKVDPYVVDGFYTLSFDLRVPDSVLLSNNGIVPGLILVCAPVADNGCHVPQQPLVIGADGAITVDDCQKLLSQDR
jgi:hypothetical protein